MISWKIVGSGIVALGIIATAYFAVSSYRNMAKQNQQLTTKVKSLEADNQALQRSGEAIAETVDKNDTHTTRVIERTREIERQINNAPKTNSCLSSPSIAALIDGLRDNEQQNTDLP